MQFILVNCTPKLQTMGINTSVDGWQSQLSSKLTSYVTAGSWSYDPGSDTLIITPVQGTTISMNLTDFGDAGGMML